MDDRPWRGFLVSLLVGAVVALLCIRFLGGRGAPTQPVEADRTQSQNSVGVEFVLRFCVLLPEGGREG